MTLRNFLKIQSPKIDKSNFDFVVQELVYQLKILREQFIFGGVTGLKSEHANVKGIKPFLETDSEIDFVLKAYQVVCVVGFVWDYIDLPTEQLEFEQMLIEGVGIDNNVNFDQYREKYLTCQDDINELCKRLAVDVYTLWGSPDPHSNFMRALQNAAHVLGILSQAEAAKVCGDSKVEMKLRRMIVPK